MLENPKIKVGVQTAPGIELAAERAESICEWLVMQGGVSISRLRTTGSASSSSSGSGAASPSSVVGDGGDGVVAAGQNSASHLWF